MPLDRPAVVDAPIGSKLLLRRMTGREELGRLFVYELDVLSEDHAIKPASLLGQSVTVTVQLEKGGERHFNGIVSRFARIGLVRKHAVYHVTLRPWLWLLSRTTDCRIFQNDTAPNVIKQLFRENGMTDIDDALTGTYRSWEYLVQYRETTLNFVTRMMEQEGLYYYFKHEQKKHTLVLADSYSAHETTPGYAEVPYYPPEEQARRERDHIDTWSVSEQIEPGTYVLNDFDFERPKAGLEAKSSLPRKHAHAEMEYYDYPGEYFDVAEGEELVKIRRQALDAQYEQVEGHGDVRGLGAGSLFKLTGSPQEDQNREYLILRTDYAIDCDHFESTAGAGGEETAHFRCGLTAIESHTQYRLQELTPKPTISGPQTAIVVGKASEEIWTDEHGRVKLQFHWDRRGKSNENSSCWVRVAQYWAGSRFGSIHIPRIGQEVMVEFLEGDPDRPIVTGRVYNGNNMPPYDLPANQTQSGWKSRSSKGGNPDNFNEIRFEDKKGSEQVFVQAEKDLEINVKNNESRTVGADRSKSVGGSESVTIGSSRTETVGTEEKITIGTSRTETVGTDETITIGANRTETVGANETITIGANQTITISANRTENVAANETITISGARTESVATLETINIGAAQMINIGAAQALNVGGGRMVNVGVAQVTEIGASESHSVGGSQNVNVGGGRNASVGGNDTLNVGKKLGISAAEEIALSAGSASITLKKSGEIVISGKDISIKGSGKITINASGDMVIKGSKISQN